MSELDLTCLNCGKADIVILDAFDEGEQVLKPYAECQDCYNVWKVDPDFAQAWVRAGKPTKDLSMFYTEQEVIDEIKELKREIDAMHKLEELEELDHLDMIYLHHMERQLIEGFEYEVSG